MKNVIFLNRHIYSIVFFLILRKSANAQLIIQLQSE